MALKESITHQFYCMWLDLDNLNFQECNYIAFTFLHCDGAGNWNRSSREIRTHLSRKLKPIFEEDENTFILFSNDIMTHRELKSILEDDESTFILFSKNMMTCQKLQSIFEKDENPFILNSNDMMTYRKLKSILEEDEITFILFSNAMMAYRKMKSILEKDGKTFILFSNEMMQYRKMKSILEGDVNTFILFSNDMMTYRKLKSILKEDENTFILFNKSMMTCQFLACFPTILPSQRGKDQLDKYPCFCETVIIGLSQSANKHKDKNARNISFWALTSHHLTNWGQDKVVAIVKVALSICSVV